jgi:hypothetical protein
MAAALNGWMGKVYWLMETIRNAGSIKMNPCLMYGYINNTNTETHHPTPAREWGGKLPESSGKNVAASVIQSSGNKPKIRVIRSAGTPTE